MATWHSGTLTELGYLGANREMHSACTVWEISDAFLAMLSLPTIIFCLQDYSQWYILFNILRNLSGFLRESSTG